MSSLDPSSKYWTALSKSLLNVGRFTDWAKSSTIVSLIDDDDGVFCSRRAMSISDAWLGHRKNACSWTVSVFRRSSANELTFFRRSGETRRNIGVGLREKKNRSKWLRERKTHDSFQVVWLVSDFSFLRVCWTRICFECLSFGVYFKRSLFSSSSSSFAFSWRYKTTTVTQRSNRTEKNLHCSVVLARRVGLQSDFGTTKVTTFGIVSNGVTGSHTHLNEQNNVREKWKGSFTHCGTGRFCFCFFAKIFLTFNVLCEGI